ncbi:MAG: MFS family permease [Sulfitobacter sp.]|jgi:MFS family permease
MAMLLKNRNYRMHFSAAAISNLGDGVSALAFPWLATLITRDPLLISLVAFAAYLPWLLLAIPAGVLTDRTDRRRLMVQADVIRFALTTVIVALAFAAPQDPLPMRQAVPYIAAIAALAFLLGTAEVLRDNAAQTVLPALVDKSDLEAANGQLWSIENIMGKFIGPPLAGLLIAFAVPAPFVLDAASFALAAALVWCVAIPARVLPSKRSFLAEARQGLAWMGAHRQVLQLALMLGAINFCSMMFMTMLVLYSQEVLGLSAAAYGILLTAGAAGGVIAGIVWPRLTGRLGAQNGLMLALALMPIPPLLIVLTGSPWMAGAALFLETVIAVLWNVITVSYRQRLIPDELLGRVNSIYRFFGWGAIPFGALAGGVLVASFQPSLGRLEALEIPFWAASAGFTLVFIYGAARLRIGRI